MPGDGNPRDAIVSIWRHGGDGTFRGSGAFVTPQFVLTAKHVVELQTPQSLRIGLVHGHERVAVQAVHCHPTCDIALLDLGRDFPQQGLVRLDCNRSALEGTIVDLYGVNPDTLSRDECQSYTLGTWRPDPGDYLFDHAQRKGFSGGVAVSQGGVVGVITERHTREQQGVMTPLHVAKEWLQGFLAPALLAPSPLDLQLRDEQSQSAFTQQVRREIGNLFKQRRLRPLMADLSEPHGHPESLLIPQETSFSIETAVKQLHDATRKCLQRIVDQDPNITADVVDGATRVLGWLVILAVRETWVQDMAKGHEPGTHFQQILGATHIVLPVETEAGTEVIEARLSGRQAVFELSRGGVEVMSPHQIRPGDVELGLDTRDALIEVKKLLWNAVFKTSQAPQPFTRTHEDNLQHTLEIRYGRGQSYYLLMHPERDGWVTGRTTLLQLLRREFPYLGVFLIGSATGEPVLVMSDVRLMVLIRDFLLMCQDYV